MSDSSGPSSAIRPSAAIVPFEVLVVAPALIGLSYGWWSGLASFGWSLVLWAAVVVVVELLPVPAWRGLRISVSFPVLLAVAFLYAPVEAGTVALVASFDPREIHRQVSLLRALFNRSQIALAVLSASWVFHSLAGPESSALVVVGAATLAVIADYGVNMGLVAVAASLIYRTPPLQVARRLRIGNPVEFLVSYLGLGVLGVVLAKLYLEVGFWAVPVFVVPLIFARQMFFRSRALEEAHADLADREMVLSRLSDRMAEERQDERNQIAGYLHDDLAQCLFRLSLQIDLADRYLSNGDTAELERLLVEMKDTKNETSDKIRSLIRDLHRSPLGRAGLSEAIRSFTGELKVGDSPMFVQRVDDLPLPPSIQLLAYQIAREAITNALKYAQASEITTTFVLRGDVVELSIADDGVGFDASAGEPDGHFGLTMMKERAQVAGGSFDLVSAGGHGTVVTARFPASWMYAEGASLAPAPEPVRH